MKEGEGVPGALHEGILYLLDKKIKEFVEVCFRGGVGVWVGVSEGFCP